VLGGTDSIQVVYMRLVAVVAVVPWAGTELDHTAAWAAPAVGHIALGVGS